MRDAAKASEDFHIEKVRFTFYNKHFILHCTPYYVEEAGI
jgi:hypothetical protein